MVPSTLCIMWPMHLQRLKLLRAKALEDMHLQENILFDLCAYPWSKSHRMLLSTHYVKTYAPAKV